MAFNSVSDFKLLINNQVKAQEQIGVYLRRLEALITVAVMTIEEAAKVSQMSLNELLKQGR